MATWREELTHWKRPWCWERLRAEGEGADRGRDGWMASPTEWAWVRASSGRWWRTGKPGVLQSMGSHRNDLVTEQQHRRFTMLCSFLLYTKWVGHTWAHVPLLDLLPPSGLRRALGEARWAVRQVLIHDLFYPQYQRCMYVSNDLPAFSLLF